MIRSRIWLAVLLLGAAAIIIWVAINRARPPQVAFIKTARETLVSTLSTNGKVEPIQWMPVRAERAGVITRVWISRGQAVQSGDPLVQLDTRVASADLAKAQAVIDEAQAQEKVLTQGGRIAERQQIESDLARAHLDLAAAQKVYDSTERLVAKQAATRQELDSARHTVDQLKLHIQALEKSKVALVTGTDKDIANARLKEAQSAAAAAKVNLDLSVIRAPMNGIAYDFDLKQGAYVNPGDLIARVGRLNQVRVSVYVDEPDLGRLRKGEPVLITWDAMPGHQWKGQVDKLPSQIVPLGTRQVGEVGCIIENPDRDLLPNANINADIQADVVQDAVTIPKEAIRHQGADAGVLLLEGDQVVWRTIRLGISNFTRSQVISGLKAGDAVALSSDRPIQSGSRVQPVFQ